MTEMRWWHGVLVAGLAYIIHHVRKIRIILNGKNPKTIDYEDKGK